MKTNKGLFYKEYILSLFHTVAAPHNRIPLLFTIEGTLIMMVNNLINNNNYLFATRLGASDFKLSLVMMLPQLVGLLVLIPGGILTDRMANKRRMVITSLALLIIFYILIGFSPALGSYKLEAFLILLAISTGPMTVYNTSWQAYFSDIVPIEERNGILTYRTALTFLIGIIIPLGSGWLLTSAATTGSKIKIHQAFFFISGVLLLLQIFVLKQIKGSHTHAASSGIGIRNLKSALADLAHNRKFLGFVSVAMFFYMTWMIDWTLYYIGEVNYLKMNEAWLSYVNIGNCIAQFVTLGFWSRLNVKRGVRFGIIFGNLGLATYAIGMVISTSIPENQGKVVFLIFNIISSLGMATVTLNILQCLLQVIPEKNKTLNISIYTVLVTLSNAVMPFIGISIYTRLGGNLKALHTIFWMIFALRLASTGLWTLRWWLLRKDAY